MLLEKWTCILALVTCGMLPVGCMQQGDTGPHDAASTRQSKALRYPYVASASRQQQIIDGHRQIRIGMTEKDVSSLMGEPDETNPTYEPKIKNPRQIGFSQVYVLQQLKPSGSVDDMQEKLVRVHYNQAGSVVQIVPVGMPNPDTR